MRSENPYRPKAISAYSLVTALAVTIVSPLGAKPQPPGPNALLSILLYLISGKYIIPSGLISMSSAGMGCSNASAASLLNACVESPWNERAQSTCGLPSSRTKGVSSKPLVRSGRGSVAVWAVVAAWDAGAAAAAALGVFGV